MKNLESKFEMGQLVSTSGVGAKISEDEEFATFVKKSFERHRRADWGEMDAEDLKSNDDALKSGDARLFSAYKKGEEKIWIITEADRTVTTILFPDEY